MRWAEITIKTTEEASEAICEMLAQAGADGIASQDPQEFRNTIDNDPLSYCDDGTIESYGVDVVIKAYFAETDDGVIRMGAKSEEFANPDGVGMIYGSINKSPPTRRSHSRGTPRFPAPLHLSPFSPPDRDRWGSQRLSTFTEVLHFWNSSLWRETIK